MRTATRSASAPSSTIEAPIFICEVCKVRLGTAGYLAMHYAELEAYEAAEAAWAEEHPGPVYDVAALDTHPELVRWHVLHAACDRDPDAVAYWIGADTVTTWRSLLGWTAHVMGKAWIDKTNWPDVLRRAGAK